MLTLFWSARSPFARKVMVAAHELGIAERIETVRVVVSGTAPNEAVLRHNPLGQIPTLLLEDGTALFDSAVILDFLDHAFGGQRLIPRDAARRFAVLRLQAIGDGIMENSVRRLGERSRGALGSAPHAEGHRLKIGRALDRVEQEVASLAGVDAGSIAVACGLGHLDFRFGDDDWRATRPCLAAWYAEFSARPSMQATAHRDER